MQLAQDSQQQNAASQLQNDLVLRSFLCVIVYHVLHYTVYYTVCQAPILQKNRIIAPNYLTDERDLAALVAGVKLARQIAAALALQPFCGPEVLPGSKAVNDHVNDCQCQHQRADHHDCRKSGGSDQSSA
ncbi:MAG: hypothetical protein DYG89_00080 [Caldilinea sp. CFX5]|nr:hypothetical protein [Caldilinea sp. CFX5]